MSSLTTSPATATGTTTKTYSSSFTTTSPTVSSWPLFSKTSKKCAIQSLKHKVSCNAGSSENLLNNLDRRNVLLGLGGLAGAVNLTSVPSVGAAPLAAPDISKCGTNPLSGFKPGENTPTGGDCCPPNSTLIKDFEFPTNQAFKVRPAAHLLSAKYIAKFNEAIKRMKALPEDDPRNFLQQAHIHCAYCNGAYTQSSSGFPDIEIQIHNSWLFFPFHRWYLYFYERILGSLIDDPTFALPFWNWDTPAGMTIPKYFNDPKSALFDTKRNQAHLKGVVDLGYNGKDTDATDIEKVKNNLAIMYRQMVTNATDPTAFFGGEYRAGKEPISGGGSVEQSPHTPVHRWVGDPREPNGENLGNFYSAGRDTLFYCHHSNVDRMWSLWKMLGGKHKDITDTDWLNTSFVFYDENKNLVRVYVKDCLLTNQLGYDYQRVDVPWLKSKPVPRAPRSGVAKKLIGKVKKSDDVVFPVKLDKTVKVLVPRAKKSRSKKEKEEKEEILVIQGITYDSEKYVKFDVYVNDEDDDDDAAPDQTEFAGSFAQLPHKHKGKTSSKTNFRAGLTELLEELEADDDENVLITVVPRSGSEDITIDAIKIIYA
ncbi:putative catechol oxidase [Helianthus annuus]|nr:putative catechol oxidase [Helianthus annuus]KAJ0522901.1 putative catechol oxidase [Helianthus annuus]KAJ0880628.1 putative catechol oxidase [Helianthus annuus]